MDFIVVSLRGKLEEIKNDNAKYQKLEKALSSFRCSKSDDEEKFIKERAIDFEKTNKARTYLLVSNNAIIAYFTLAIKSIDFESTVSPAKKKSISAGSSNTKTYSAYLIGHIAKDDSVQEEMGTIILDQCFDLIKESQKIVGGRIVYLDCKDEEKIKNIYITNGFKFLQKSENTQLLQYYQKI